jgi:hypothetical protein
MELMREGRDRDLTAVVVLKRKLALDYLAHNCYTKTATALVDTQLFGQGEDDEDDEFDEDRIEIAEHRQGRKILLSTSPICFSYLFPISEIRDLILVGKIDQAIRQLDKHFPSVLSASKERSVPASKISAASNIPISVASTHLALNLRIQSFLELSRTLLLPHPSEIHPTTERISSPSMASKAGQQSASSMDRASQKRKIALLGAAQSLLIETNRLEPKYRALYLKELTEVSVVMAYPQPESSPAKAYLGMERRQALAEQVDAAILCRYRSLYVALSSLLLDRWVTHSNLVQIVLRNPRNQLYLN